ncbi:MAG: lipopolysaccharide transport system ATP-binding protein [Acidimicrobiaceae bacterium]|jgi:lipopolysaccharide transport system ATP-binding protein
MSSSELAISVRGLSKSYIIRHNTTDHITVAELALDRIRHPLRRAPKEEFWALKDIDVDVHKGEVLGVIGRNGAGKSTLLKVLTRITEPTTGRIDVWGRVGSLLEVGTGFHPELTGRENVYLNGSILGMTRKEIAKQFDAIVDFAGVERFLDTPVKRFSSGMYVRLAFAVAAHLETEILLVDEVLAVGDQEFQKKCLSKMREVAADGRTVLFVSHQMASIESLCHRCLVLANGAVLTVGATSEAVVAYLEAARSGPGAQGGRRSGTGEVRVVDVSPRHASYGCAEEKIVRFVTSRSSGYAMPYFVAAHVVNESDGVIVAQCDSRLQNTWGGSGEESSFELRLHHPWLLPGEYRVDVFVCNAGVLDAVESACRFSVSPIFPYEVPAVGESVANSKTLASFSYDVQDEPRDMQVGPTISAHIAPQS